MIGGVYHIKTLYPHPSKALEHIQRIEATTRQPTWEETCHFNDSQVIGNRSGRVSPRFPGRSHHESDVMAAPRHFSADPLEA